MRTTFLVFIDNDFAKCLFDDETCSAGPTAALDRVRFQFLLRPHLCRDATRFGGTCLFWLLLVGRDVCHVTATRFAKALSRFRHGALDGRAVYCVFCISQFDRVLDFECPAIILLRDEEANKWRGDSRK